MNTPKREIVEQVLDDMEIATMAAITGTTNQIHFAAKPFFFFNSVFAITLGEKNRNPVGDFWGFVEEIVEGNEIWNEETKGNSFGRF